MYLRPGSQADINHLTLKNATVGMLIDSNAGGAMKIRNTQIYDCSNVGILARTATIEGSNIVINSTGQFDVALTKGGTYNFTHCTFNNNWPGNNPLALLVQNYQEYSNAPTDFYPMTANFNNCIIFGNNQIEMALDLKNDIQPVYKFTNCLIKFNNINNQFTNNPFYDFTVAEHYLNNKINTGSSVTNAFVPDFLDVDTNKLNIGDNSAAKGLAEPSFSALFPLDILNKDRATSPDSGAYESVIFEN
ncbi:hypothetical protein [Flavobacterium sp. 3HN19-14]|uniref:hypothetical protein n=1 Tax=Flavobacterium sp. 3HN19-14 TaxID=3448133 RepID=UPI003EE105FC